MFVPLRSRRRHDHRRMLRIWKLRGNADGPADPRRLGVMTSTHGRPYNCSLLCGNRRQKEGPTLAERVADQAWT